MLNSFGTLHLQARTAPNKWETLNRENFSSSMEYLNVLSALETLRSRWINSDLHRLSTFRIVEETEKDNPHARSL